MNADGSVIGCSIAGPSCAKTRASAIGETIVRHLLIGWELGAGIGHLYRMVPIVRSYLACGWRVTIAARHLTRAKEVFAAFLTIGEDRFAVLQAPIFLHRATEFAERPVSLADVFAHIGFADARLCRPVVRAWRRLLGELTPDIILSDFSPSLNVAAAGACPVLVIGNGWTIPPAGTSPRFDGTQGDRATQTAGDRIVEALAIASDGHWSAPELCDVLRGDANFVCTLPQLDPYGRLRTNEHYWPAEIPMPKVDQANARDAVVIYLPGDHAALALVEDVAERLPWRWHGYTGGGGRAAERRVPYSREPLNLAEILPSARLAIHHGGLGMANWCLIHGVPQIIFPTDIEKSLVGRGVENAKSGLVCDERMRAEQLLQIITMYAGNHMEHLDTSTMKTISDIDTLTALIDTSNAIRGDQL